MSAQSKLRGLYGVAIVALPLAAIVAACSGGDRAGNAGGGDFNNGPVFEQPCVDGQERACGITLRREGKVVDCMQATQVCHGTTWGECGEKGPVTTSKKEIPEGWTSDYSAASTKGFGGPVPCASNPCNPYCKEFPDTVCPLDGSIDGALCVDGGLSTTPTTPGVDGGAPPGALDGDKFGERANYGGPCTKNSDCNVDQYCKKTPPTAPTGICTSFADGEFNAACVQPATAYGALKPKITCQLVNPGDNFTEFFGAFVTGQFDKTFTTPPAVVGIANRSVYQADNTKLHTEDFYGRIKLFNAKKCEQVLSIPNAAGVPADPDGIWAPLPFQLGTTPLLVDLNDDGVPEIVAWSRVGSVGGVQVSRLFAFSIGVTIGADKITATYAVQPYAGWKDPDGRVGRAWTSSNNANGNKAAYFPVDPADGSGPTAIDLNNDGKPEIIANGHVVNRLGQLIGLRPVPSGWTQAQAVERRGYSPIVGDFDLDGKVEIIERQGLFEATSFTVTSGELTGMAWVADSRWAFPTMGGSPVPPNLPSYSAKAWHAVADFGDYGGAGSANMPEVAWVSENKVRVMAINGAPVFGFDASTSPAPPAGLAGEVAVPGGGGGGINIADFDGDGLPEIGIAGASYYTVFDIDCVSPRSYKGKTGTCNRTGAACDCLSRGDCGTGTSCPAGVLWSRLVQDQSSFVTGSTVFDFNADGKSEVVYADECWTRVYDGQTGDVVFSTVHSSGTVTEQPIVADVDLDGRADLIVPNERVLEHNPGEGMFCPTRIERATGFSAGSPQSIFRGTFDVVRNGTAELRFGYSPGASKVRITRPDGTFADLAVSADPTLITTHMASTTVTAAHPKGQWTFDIYLNCAWCSGSLNGWWSGLALDGSTEPATIAGTPNGKGTDAQFKGLRCASVADCPSGAPMTCDSGFCRCSADAQCGTGFSCIDPPTGTPGSGRTCRPTRSYGDGTGVSGLQVWSGPGAGWAQSRYIWNDHAYTPALIKDDGKVKPTATCTADEAAAWTPANPRENSFRQQLQYPGTTAYGIPDYTVKYPCKENYLQICNRGAGTAPPGVMVVGFPGNAAGFEGSSDKNVTVGPCYTTAPLAPGACVEIFCSGAGKGTEEYLVNPSCSGGTCIADKDCKGTATCNLATGYCTATCTKEPAIIGAKPPMPECTDGAGGWSFVHGGKTGACGGGTAPPSATLTRDFFGDCPSGTAPKWGLFQYDTNDPIGTNVTFVFETATTAAGLATAVAPAVKQVAQPGYSPLGGVTATADKQVCRVSSSPACYINLATQLTPNNNPYLRMEATLNPHPTTGVGPTLNWWNVTYDCLPTE